jgi:hypothetical protein
MQGWPLHALVKGVMHTVKYIHRYLSLPRLRPLTVLGKPSTTTGRPRLYPTRRVSLMAPHALKLTCRARWQAKPWYKSQSNSLLDRFAVLAGLYDDLPGPKYKCEGYRLEEMVLLLHIKRLFCRTYPSMNLPGPHSYGEM